MSILDIHAQMLQGEEEEQEKTAEVEEQVDVLTKYAAAAEELLEDEYGEEYNEDDVIKLAQYLINADVEYLDQYEKVAEFDQYGRVMARAYVDEILKATENE